MSTAVPGTSGATHDGASGRILALVVLLIALVVATIGLTVKDVPGLSFIGAEAYAPVEPPPAEYDGRPFDVPGVTERYFDDAAELNAFCLDALGALLLEGESFRACYVETLGLIALPSRKVVGKRELRELRRHEHAHHRGWRHEARPLDMKSLMKAWNERKR